MSATSVFHTYRVTDDEFLEMERKFGQLTYFMVWQLKNKNTRNNYTEDVDDFRQEIRFALMQAGCYCKRQTFLEDCFKALSWAVKDEFGKMVVAELERLWTLRTRHGANRQRFGTYQETMLEQLVRAYVPPDRQPDKNKPLVFDARLDSYCKTSAWNRQKNMGKKITRERAIRNGMVSLSEFDFFSGSAEPRSEAY